MRLEQLKYFEILSQEGSFNKAAAKAHITQPALTVNIKSMEKELDTLLVIRKPHGVSLTEEGQKVLAFSQKFRLCIKTYWPNWVMLIRIVVAIYP